MSIMDKLEKYILGELMVDQGMEIESIEPDEDLISKGVIDSLGILKLTDFVEKTFDIKIVDEDMEPENFKTLNSLKGFIESKQQRGA